jgi:hypothetical protein
LASATSPLDRRKRRGQARRADHRADHQVAGPGHGLDQLERRIRPRVQVPRPAHAPRELVGAAVVGQRHVLDVEALGLLGQRHGVGAGGKADDLEAHHTGAVQVLHDVEGVGPDGAGRAQQDQPPVEWLGGGRHSSGFSSRICCAAVRVSLRRLR